MLDTMLDYVCVFLVLLVFSLVIACGFCEAVDSTWWLSWRRVWWHFRDCCKRKNNEQ